MYLLLLSLLSVAALTAQECVIAWEPAETSVAQAWPNLQDIKTIYFKKNNAWETVGYDAKAKTGSIQFYIFDTQKKSIGTVNKIKLPRKNDTLTFQFSDASLGKCWKRYYNERDKRTKVFVEQDLQLKKNLSEFNQNLLLLGQTLKLTGN